jgi:hypothetical protein
MASRLIRRRWVGLTAAAVALMAAASIAGVYVPAVYANETASWAAQGVGQDIVNLCLVLPAALICLDRSARGSLRAALVLLGLLIYVIYSYTLYSFFVHFGPVFPVYVAILGLAFYSFVGILLDVNTADVRGLFAAKRGRAQSAYLMASAVAFGAMWLSAILTAVATGTTPRDVVEAGLPVNPVHVLDLAFILPAMIVTSVSLWRGRLLGRLLTVPLLTFAAAMGFAIVGMMLVMRARGLAAPSALIGGLSAVSGLAVVLTFDFLRPAIRAAGNPAPVPD